MCGCQFFKTAYVTSFLIALLIFILEKISISYNQYIVTIKYDDNQENILNIIKNNTKKYAVKNRSSSDNQEHHLIIEFSTKDINGFEDILKDCKDIKEYSIIECNNGDMFC